MRSWLRPLSPTRLAVFLVLAVTAFRLWYAVQLELVADEAYYWLWSKHLAASYRDKGPAIAWTIALGTKIFGDTVFGIRFFAVLFSSATGGADFPARPPALRRTHRAVVSARRSRDPHHVRRVHSDDH
jgi:hypothetical protein